MSVTSQNSDLVGRFRLPDRLSGFDEDLSTQCNEVPDWKLIFTKRNDTYPLAA